MANHLAVVVERIGDAATAAAEVERSALFPQHRSAWNFSPHDGLAGDIAGVVDGQCL
jgi:hypothetical protein